MRSKSLFFVIGIILTFNSIIYGTLNTEMFIDGDVYVRIDKDIRIAGIRVIEQVGGAYETYDCDYSKDTTSLQVTLPSGNSTITYEVTITNKGDIDYEVTNIIEESYSNSNIKYEIFDLEKGAIIKGGTTYVFKIKFTIGENSSDNSGILVLKYIFEEWASTLYDVVSRNSKSLDTNMDFSVAPTKETSGVYEINSTKDDKYPVYYYRGIVENNNVNFAGFCWKMVRTTSTGGVKLVYNGVSASDGSCNNTGANSIIGSVQYNTSCASRYDVSYIYDNGSDSNIKKVIEDWYSKNISDYTNSLEDIEWCNDRSFNFSNNVYSYGSQRRLISPSIVCPNDEDKLTVKGGKLKYPVAMLTVDEATLAGQGVYGYTSSGYLNINRDWWSLSPAFFAGSWARVYPISGVGNMSNDHTNQTNGCRPTISLVPGIRFIEGDGTNYSPYKILGS